MADAERSEGTATTTATDPETAAFDYDVAIVGGGPTGCSAGVFTGRYGLDTVAFDRGRSSLQRCAYLENYLGFPGGVDVETFYGLIHDHVEAAGCDLVPALVEAVEPAGGDGTETADAAGPGFEVTTQDGETVTARRVVAAARYGGDFLEPLDDDEMFVTYEYDGETRTKFDRDYADIEGRTAIDGLYVAAPVSEVNVQAIMSAGQGARVGRSVITDHRLERGIPRPSRITGTGYVPNRNSPTRRPPATTGASGSTAESPTTATSPKSDSANSARPTWSVSARCTSPRKRSKLGPSAVASDSPTISASPLIPLPTPNSESSTPHRRRRR